MTIRGPCDSLQTEILSIYVQRQELFAEEIATWSAVAAIHVDRHAVAASYSYLPVVLAKLPNKYTTVVKQRRQQSSFHSSYILRVFLIRAA
jgi:hypothetical protein